MEDKAKQRALEKYPLMADDDKEGLEALKYIGMECDCASVYNEVQEAKQVYFIEGYRQAEKDLELSWEDIKLVHNITYEESRNVALNKGGEISEQEFYQEVLKRFKEKK